MKTPTASITTLLCHSTSNSMALAQQLTDDTANSMLGNASLPSDDISRPN